ncbi:hypothetical protein ACWGE1_09810 [Streptomyces sp. NPDC054932]
MGEFVARHRGELDRVLDVVRRLGAFRPDTMDILDGLGYLREHDVPAAILLMWSGCIEELTPDIGAPATVRRMARMGADLQTTRLLHALVGVAVFRGSDDLEVDAGGIAEVIEAVCPWGETGRGRSTREVFLMWRVAFLPSVLLPGSNTHGTVKRRFRAYARVLETMLEQ